MAQESKPYVSATLGTAEWKGTSRYQVVGCLGRGGMGAVYEVFDRERDQAVALKTLLHVDPAGLYRFKQEFRTLADVQHANLVRLYELVIRETGEIFFTMELVRGKEFTQYTRVPAPASEIVPLIVRPMAGSNASPPASKAPPAVASRETRSKDGLEVRARPEAIRRITPADEQRLRPALCQLVAGIKALHAAGKLHRDIKPSNALVTEEGRVVLLDFGVATELSSRDGELAGGSQEMVGTALYMAPEQADEAPPTPASDWYSVGVMLYEALVGTPPFVGSAIEVITMKATMAAPLPSASVDGVPPDLDALCRDLLDIEPDKRPQGDEILRRLGMERGNSSAPPAKANAEVSERDAELVGRDAPLLGLASALQSACAGRTTTVFVTGASGMGKTRLVNHFLDGLVAQDEVTVLRGRAYEREAVPYKAFDAVMDSLSRHLLRLLEEGHELSLPDDCWLLGRVFPVLQRIPALESMAQAPIDEPQMVRRRAFAALRELLRTMSERRPVVIFVDDVHWGDADSAALLLELVRPPSTAALLVVMTYQPTKQSSPFLNEIREQWPTEADQRQMPVEPLTIEDAQRLALLLMGSTDESAQNSALAVARESLGQPFLIEELVRANRGYLASPGTQSLAVVSVEQMIGERLGRLPEAARQLAEIVAVGGQALPVSVTIRAAELDPLGADDLVAMVCARRFARTGLHNGRDVVESTYDQIRERVVAQLPPDRLRRHHAALARALEEAPDRDGEAIAEHWLGAGEPQRAASMALEAAERALTKFAFDQSARLFRLALDHTPPASADGHTIRVRLAQALQMAGRSTESGRQYLRAVATAPAGQRMELQRIAAEQLLAAGRIEEGDRILREVLESCGMRAPRSPLAALFWLIVYSIWIRLRGYNCKERPVSEVSDANRMRVDALYTVGMGFGFIDSILSICMWKRHCIEALRVGDRVQVLVAYATQITHMASERCVQDDRERTLVRRARDLATRTGEETASYLDIAMGLALFYRAQWRQARELLQRGEVGMQRVGNRVLAINARLFADYTYYYNGDWGEYRRRTSRFLAEAEDRGDLYTRVMMTVMGVSRSAMLTGETERARQKVRDVLAQWPGTRFSVQHWLMMTTAAELDVYDGFGGRAYDAFMRNMPALKKSLLLGNWYMRVDTLQTRGRLAIASIASCPEARGARIAEARKVAELLSREPNAWAAAMGSLVKASAEIASGDRTAAITELRRTVALHATADSDGGGIVARYRLGQILGDDEGRELVRNATETFQKQWGVSDVARYVNVYLPGEIESLGPSA